MSVFKKRLFEIVFSLLIHIFFLVLMYVNLRLVNKIEITFRRTILTFTWYLLVLTM